MRREDWEFQTAEADIPLRPAIGATADRIDVAIAALGEIAALTAGAADRIWIDGNAQQVLEEIAMVAYQRGFARGKVAGEQAQVTA